MARIKKHLHQLFRAGVLLKAFNSAWETASALLLLSSMHPIMGWHSLGFFSREEFIGGRDDYLFHMAAQQLNYLSVSTKNFIGVYLLLHGLLNMFLAYNLYKGRLWAYPVAIAITSLFLIYQFYRLFHTHSPILFGVTLFDILFVFLTWHEYEEQKKQRHTI